MSAVLDTTCQKCGGAGFYEQEVAVPDFLNGGDIAVVIKECLDCTDEDDWRTDE